MAKNNIEFDTTIFMDLLSFADNNEKIISIDSICQKYGISNRLASAYRFAVVNQLELKRIFGSLEQRQDKSKAIIADLKYDVAILKKKVDILTARNDFLEAIDIWNTYEDNPIRIVAVNQKEEEFTAISTLSDAHVDEEVLKSTVNNLNEYNPAIAEERLRRYFSRLLFVINRYRCSGHKIKHLVLGILGDLISGYIHEELMENNTMSPTEATIFVQNIIIDGLRFLSNDGEFESITVVMIRGNHGRTSHKKKYSTGYKNSYEWMLYTQIQKMFTKHLSGFNNLHFRIPTSEYEYVNIYHTVNGFSHGDHFNYRGGVGGVVIPMMNWMYRQNKIIPADKRWIGHWHQHVILPNGCINGSVIGFNAYAMGVSAQPEPPKMQFQLVSNIKGYTANEPIYLLDF